MRRVFRWNPDTGEFYEAYNSEARFEAPAIRTDEIAPTEHPATGRIFTSRAKFDEETIRSGCVPVAGCDKPIKPWESQARKEERAHRAFDDAFERAYYDVRDKRVPEFRMNPEVRDLWRRVNGHRDE